jgi:uncharacterized repeat protein (TIGR02543 family)
MNPVTRNAGTRVNEPIPPARQGYSFLGWYTSAASSGTKYDWPYTLNADVTMYAHWVSNEDRQQADDFKESDAVKEALEKDAAEIGLGDKAEDLANAKTKVDEALAAWDKLPEGAKEALAEEKARLDAVKQKIENVDNAHEFQGSHTETLAKKADDVKTLEDVTALLPGLEKALEEFDILPDPVKELLQDDIALLESLKQKAETIVEENATGKDRADADAFKNAHAGILAKAPENIVLGDEAAVDAALQAYSALSEVVKALLAGEHGKLSALKEKIETLKPIDVTITFDTHGGPEVPPVQANAGTAVNKPDDPAWTGYTFLGWFPSASGGTAYAWPYTPNADITMHAQWQENAPPPPQEYTITFDSHEGSAVPAIKANAGTVVNKPDDPVWTGYTFLGWFPTASGGTA